jgi:[acyl-carrier-protein] S-malonyltransferase
MLEKEKIALVFPGQGSQKVGMMSALADNALVRNTFLEASDVLGYDLWSLVQNGPEEQLNQTAYTQPAILTASVAGFRSWLDTEHGLQTKPLIAHLAGHSLGEYSALVFAEVLSLSAAVKLVSLRGRFMQEAVPVGLGGMAVFLGLNDEQVRALCQKVSSENEKVCAVNYNCPSQVVVAGHSQAVQRAIEEAKLLGAKRATLLPMSVPSHCDLMRPAAEKLQQALAEVKLNKPKFSILHNADLCAHQEESEIREVLLQQLYLPVRWSETIQKMEDLGVKTIYECGPGKVLSGLNRRIVPNLQCEVLPEVEVVCQ